MKIKRSTLRKLIREEIRRLKEMHDPSKDKDYTFMSNYDYSHLIDTINKILQSIHGNNIGKKETVNFIEEFKDFYLGFHRGRRAKKAKSVRVKKMAYDNWVKNNKLDEIRGAWFEINKRLYNKKIVIIDLNAG